MTLNDHLMASPPWLLAWLAVLSLVNFGAVFFAISDKRARFILLAMILNVFFMSALFEVFGYTRILGLSHVVFWTPLLIYLWKSRSAHPERVWTGRYIRAVLLVNGLSLVIDYIDVIRFIAGDRAPL